MTSQEAKRPRLNNDEKTNQEKLLTFTEGEMKDLFRWCLDNTQIKKPLKPSKKTPKNTLLHYATAKGYTFLLEVLLEKKVFDMNAVGEWGESPLMTAIKKGYTEMASLLVQKGADIFTKVQQQSPLHFASRLGQEEIVSLLIEKGADINDKDTVMNTPLHIAIKYEHYKVAIYLLKKGAYPDSKDSTGNTPLHLIASDHIQDPKKKVELAKLLIEKGADMEASNDSEVTPLDYAFKHNHLQKYGPHLAKFLIVKGATGIFSYLPFLILNDNFELATFLIPYVSDSDLQNMNNMQYLHNLIGKGYHTFARMLIEKGASIEATDILKCTPLHIAAQNGHIDIARLLIDKGCNINAVNINHDTPLHNAIDYNPKNIDMIELLLQNGANMNLKDKEGKTPKDLAFECKDLELITMFYEAEKKSKSQNEPKPKNDDCIVCFNPKNGIFALLPCGHAMTCETCSMNIIQSSEKPECPMCRQPVTIYQKIFM